MGLGVGCTIPPPALKCPYHIGVVLSKRFAEYDHELAQQYTDSFDNVARAKDNIKWVVARGDLVTNDGSIEKRVKILQKLTRTGKTTGRVTVVLSQHAGPREPSTQLTDAIGGMCFQNSVRRCERQPNIS